MSMICHKNKDLFVLQYKIFDLQRICESAFEGFFINSCVRLSTILQTVEVFESLGTSLDSGTCTLSVGGTQLLATAASILLVDKAGRRVLLIAS